MKKKKKTATRIIWGVVIAAVVVAVGVFAGLSIYRASKITASNANYSAGLLDDGLIENVNVSECVKLADYENHIIPLDEVKATDEEIEQSINSPLNSHKELSLSNQNLFLSYNRHSSALIILNNSSSLSCRLNLN